MKIAGILLAGGQSRRFGEPKALAKWNGKTFIEHSTEALQAIAEDVVVISYPSITNTLVHMLNVPIVEDISRYKGNGPLAGLLTGMNAVKADWYIVAPCDTPNISKEWAWKLMEHIDGNSEAIVPVIDGRKQPLLALYHHDVKERIESLLQKEKRSVQQLLSQCSVRYVTGKELGLSTLIFFNVNTKEDYNHGGKGE